MTGRYLVGELSLVLGELQAVAIDEAAATTLAELRREVEMLPLVELRSAVGRALAVADAMCWASLMQLDRRAFDCQTPLASELFQLAEGVELIVGSDWES